MVDAPHISGYRGTPCGDNVQGPASATPPIELSACGTRPVGHAERGDVPSPPIVCGWGPLEVQANRTIALTSTNEMVANTALPELQGFSDMDEISTLQQRC